MNNQMKPNEMAALLRNIADVYEKMNVDHLQRQTMREAATMIETLAAEVKKLKEQTR